MLRHYHKLANKSERKLRLLACACCRCIWPLLADEKSRKAVEIAEHFADEAATHELFKAAGADASRAFQEARSALQSLNTTRALATSQGAEAVLKLMRVNVWAGVEDVPILALTAAKTAAHKGDDAEIEELEIPSSKKMSKATARRFAQAIFDVVGDPFAPATFEGAWRTGPPMDLANRIYNNREFDQLNALGDALAAAGCATETILNHCSAPGIHFRGCWVLDLVLDKK
jgi:hypothetical protein